MKTTSRSCDHRWRYFVHVPSKAIRVRECELCRQRTTIPARPTLIQRPKMERLGA